MGSRGSRTGTVSIADRQVSRFLQNPTILDTSDGSSSIFTMKHEEGFAVTADGQVYSHSKGDVNGVSIEDAYAARGGVIFHTHPLYDIPGRGRFGVSLSPEDILNGMSVGCKISAATTDRQGRKVIYSADFRGKDPLDVRRKLADYLRLPRVSSNRFLSNVIKSKIDTLYRSGRHEADAVHDVMTTLSKEIGFKYTKEVIS